METRSLSHGDARLQNWRVWERRSHAFSPTLTPDNSVHVHRTFAKKTPESEKNSQPVVSGTAKVAKLYYERSTADDRATDTTH